MEKVKVEVFSGDPPCPGCEALLKISDWIDKKYKDIEIVIYKGRTEEFKKYNLTSAPAIVVDGFVKIMGVCPSEKTLLSALKEAGL